jgi:hypothetical protein
MLIIPYLPDKRSFFQTSGCRQYCRQLDLRDKRFHCGGWLLWAFSKHLVLCNYHYPLLSRDSERSYLLQALGAVVAVASYNGGAADYKETEEFQAAVQNQKEADELAAASLDAPSVADE